MQKTETIPLPLTPLAKVTCYGCGGLALVSAGLSLVLLLDAVTAGRFVAPSGGIMWGVVAPGMLAFTLLSVPSQVENRRRELLARRDAGEVNVTFVEKKPAPDSVMLGITLGGTAFLAFPRCSPRWQSWPAWWPWPTATSRA
jgi:hypothetical protein